MELKFLIVLISSFALSNVNGQELIKETQLDSISVFFESGSFTIKKPNSIIKRINSSGKQTKGRIELVGYTDSVGTVESNQILASKRLRSVKQLLNHTIARDYLFDSLNLNEKHGNGFSDDNQFRRVDIKIYKVEPNFSFDTPIALKIQFKSATDYVLPSSNEAMKKLLFVMQLDENLSIKLNGHVCCSPDQPLSLNRAKRVKSFLVKNGIDEKRISCFGFSNSKKLVVENSPENQAINMRVEVIFIK